MQSYGKTNKNFKASQQLAQYSLENFWKSKKFCTPGWENFYSNPNTETVLGTILFGLTEFSVFSAILYIFYFLDIILGQNCIQLLDPTLSDFFLEISFIKSTVNMLWTLGLFK